MTRIVSFGPPPPGVAARVAAAAEVDAAVLAALQPGRTLGQIFDVLAEAPSLTGGKSEDTHS